MHFFAQLKPKSHIHIMWTSHQRKSALLDNVLFKADEDGIYSSGALTDDQINRFRVREDVVKLVAMGVYDANAITEALKEKPERELYEGFPEVDKINEQLKRHRPQLKK